MKAHQKHAKLTRPDQGNFGRRELGFIGTKCSVVKELSLKIVSDLGDRYKLAYVDADHKSFDQDVSPEFLKTGGDVEAKHLNTAWQFTQDGRWNAFDKKILFSESDLVLINSNHSEASNSILVLDKSKRASLEKRLNQVHSIEFIIDLDGEADVPDFIEDKFPDISRSEIISIDNEQAILDGVITYLNRNIPAVKALVLAGGKSSRMGEDKSSIKYHSKQQWIYMAEMLEKLGVDTYISCRRKQLDEFDGKFPLIADKYLGLGPYGAILSAFQDDPNSAWLVVACDIPLAESTDFNELLIKRDRSKIATAYYNPETQFPEPLITLWEPKAYPRLLNFLGLGYSCPRKVLINSDVNIIQARSTDVLLNANTQEEKNVVKSKLAKH